MRKQLTSLTIACVAVFAVFMIAAFADGPDDSPDPKKERTVTRKGGDFFLLWGGSSRVRSNRMESLGNRSFRGGGVRGGK